MTILARIDALGPLECRDSSADEWRPVDMLAMRAKLQRPLSEWQRFQLHSRINQLVVGCTVTARNGRQYRRATC